MHDQSKETMMREVMIGNGEQNTMSIAQGFCFESEHEGGSEVIRQKARRGAWNLREARHAPQETTMSCY